MEFKTSHLFMLTVIVCIANGLEVIQSGELVDGNAIEGCGETKGCYWEPPECAQETSTCEFILTWVTSMERVKFTLVGKTETSAPWIALGLNEEQQMSGASVVDCIVNGSDSGKVVIQMSHNSGHKNNVLNDKYLGLVMDSRSGSFNGSHVVCSYIRLASVDPQNPESKLVQNLTDPHYVLLGFGPTDGAGQKKVHSSTPVISQEMIWFMNSSNSSCGSLVRRPFGVRVHATLMIVAWMILASIGVVTPRYLKPPLGGVQYTLCNGAAWFQSHRLFMILTFSLTFAGVVVIFWHLEWDFKPPELHPLLGLVVACLVAVNPIVALFRPAPNSPRRFLFRWAHGFFGHGAHVLSVVAMYFGVQHKNARLPSWSKWIVIAFGGWRLLADLVLSVYTLIADACSAEKSSDMRALNNESQEVQPGQYRRAIIVTVYMSGTIVAALWLVVLVNMEYVSRCNG